MNSMKLLFSLVMAALVTGCATDDFQCKGGSDKKLCASINEVYNLTNNETVGQKGEKYRAEEQPVGGFRTFQMVEPTRQPLPVLKAAEVVRIWVAPWVDSKGDLMYPSYVFSEITPRRWSFGAVEATRAEIPAAVGVSEDVDKQEGK